MSKRKQTDKKTNNHFKHEEMFEGAYGPRQFVIFVSDKEWNSKYVGEGGPEGYMVSGNETLDRVLSNIPIYGLEAGIAIFIGKKLVEKIMEAWHQDIPILPLPISLSSEFNLPPGHPRGEILYAGHPCKSSTYVPAADFHRMTFEHKFAEVLRLLMHLGASTIDVEHVRGWGQDFVSRLSAGIPQAGVDGSGGVDAESSSKNRLLYHAELDGNDEPSLPDDLVWYDHEPTWRSVAEGRLEFGLRDFSLKLQYADDYGVNADLKVDAENAGFELGGSFEKHESTTWSIEGTFRD